MERDEQAGQAAPPPAQLPAAAGSSTNGITLPHCCGSARVDFNQNDPQYVFKAVYNPATSSVASSVSNNTIKLYRVSGAAVELAGELRGHTSTISDLSFSTPGQPEVLHSCSTDGTVRGWDTRSGQQTEGCVCMLCVAASCFAAACQGQACSCNPPTCAPASSGALSVPMHTRSAHVCCCVCAKPMHACISLCGCAGTKYAIRRCLVSPSWRTYWQPAATAW